VAFAPDYYVSHGDWVAGAALSPLIDATSPPDVLHGQAPLQATRCLLASQESGGTETTMKDTRGLPAVNGGFAPEADLQCRRVPSANRRNRDRSGCRSILNRSLPHQSRPCCKPWSRQDSRCDGPIAFGRKYRRRHQPVRQEWSGSPARQPPVISFASAGSVGLPDRAGRLPVLSRLDRLQAPRSSRALPAPLRSAGEQRDHFAVEDGDVLRTAAGDHVAIDDGCLVDHLGASIAQVGAY